MTKPIHLLEKGTERIGAGQFGHRIEIKTGDELQRLADSSTPWRPISQCRRNGRNASPN